MPRRNRARLVGAIALIGAPIQYLVAEAITASAWTRPRYSYLNNYVSDLGVTGPRETFLEHDIYSPAAWVMNAGFIADGVLALLGVILILWAGETQFRARPVLVLALLSTIGITLVGLFHGSLLSQQEGTLAFHFIGAPVAIISSNLMSIVVGRSYRHDAGRPWYGRTMEIIGYVGLATLVCEIIVISAVPSFPAGLFERIAVYALLAGQLLWGIITLTASVARKKSGESSAISNNAARGECDSELAAVRGFVGQ